MVESSRGRLKVLLISCLWATLGGSCSSGSRSRCWEILISEVAGGGSRDGIISWEVHTALFLEELVEDVLVQDEIEVVEGRVEGELVPADDLRAQGIWFPEGLRCPF